MNNKDIKRVVDGLARGRPAAEVMRKRTTDKPTKKTTMNIPPLDLLGYASPLGGLKIIESPPTPQKIRLSPSLNVSDEFRREFNAWLAQEFGYEEALNKDHAMLYGDCLILPPGLTAAGLMAMVQS